MEPSLQDAIRNAQDELTPKFKALQAATGALKQAARLASDEKSDALAMQKAQTKLEQAAELVEDATLQQAVAAFGQETRRALDALAFDFARNLKELFEERGETVSGRPPRLVVNELVLDIDIAARKARWVYGKEALTRPLPLSFNPILKAFDAQRRAILERKIDAVAFTLELQTAWQQLVDKRTTRPPGGRVNIIELYSQVVINRQATRFWNSPSRATFKDYERAHFVRDLVLVQAAHRSNPDGRQAIFRLAGATKAQAENAMRSLWLPSSALDGEYYASLTFDADS
ncbi:MAG: hypothetical protein HC802_08630 [Caldilineaceae bacterium]|nr:hypothetical protein [Caldilineaceae bacterium]